MEQFRNRKEKEMAVVHQVEIYQAQGIQKSDAVRRTMLDFGFLSEATVYNTLRRHRERTEASNDKRSAES